jgi:predicted nucleic acid-binding protein
MILIADAAPIIFLTKIDQLSLIRRLFDAEVLIPSVVKTEILGPGMPPNEELLLSRFLSKCRIIDVGKPEKYATSLSFADSSVLTLARKERADIVLSDDRLLRRIVMMEGFPSKVIGTIGILIRGANQNFLSVDASADLLGRLIREHNFRVSIEVYEAARRALYAEKP